MTLFTTDSSRNPVNSEFLRNAVAFLCVATLATLVMMGVKPATDVQFPR